MVVSGQFDRSLSDKENTGNVTVPCISPVSSSLGAPRDFLQNFDHHSSLLLSTPGTTT